MATIKASARREPIRLEFVDWLLTGNTRPAEPGEQYDPFVLFDDEQPDLPALWRQHRTWLVGEWQRRGNVGPCWAAREFEGV